MIELARELGLALANSSEFICMKQAQSAFEQNEAIGALMTPNPKTVHGEDLVVNAVEIMTRSAIDELPVVDDEHRLLGLIDVQDLVSKGFYK